MRKDDASEANLSASPQSDIPDHRQSWSSFLSGLNPAVAPVELPFLSMGPQR